MLYDLIIVGGGPAGASAAVYAARKRIKTLMIVEEWGGQSTVSTEVQNWIGTPSVSGADLADSLKKHALAYAGEFLTVLSPDRATGIAAHDDHVEITTSKDTHKAKAALIAA
ncbi:MAG: FAD-dependent oxidoreductase, partial [Patescibacteria group bacterium]|nr:FAD-dependent oxidoreductase [Patescibacteria group bacterium]